MCKFLPDRALASFFIISLILIVIIHVTGCESPTESSEKGPELKVDTTELFFGELLTEVTFSIFNEGIGSLEWSVFVANDAPWCLVNPDEGSGNTTIKVNVDRTKLLKPGNYSAVITVNSNGGKKEVTVHVVSSTGIIIIDTPLPE